MSQIHLFLSPKEWQRWGRKEGRGADLIEWQHCRTGAPQSCQTLKVLIGWPFPPCFVVTFFPHLWFSACPLPQCHVQWPNGAGGIMALSPLLSQGIFWMFICIPAELHPEPSGHLEFCPRLVPPPRPCGISNHTTLLREDGVSWAQVFSYSSLTGGAFWALIMKLSVFFRYFYWSSSRAKVRVFVLLAHLSLPTKWLFSKQRRAGSDIANVGGKHRSPLVPLPLLPNTSQFQHLTSLWPLPLHLSRIDLQPPSCSLSLHLNFNRFTSSKEQLNYRQSMLKQN